VATKGRVKMFASGLIYVDDVDVEAILVSTSKKAMIINELRHRAINYDEAIVNGKSYDYPLITAEAREMVDALIDRSSLTRYEKYIFKLHNKKWNFYKKSSINSGK
jgi:hypothetical protein